MKILILERGDYVPRERENWDSRSVVVDGRYNIEEAWRDKVRQPDAGAVSQAATSTTCSDSSEAASISSRRCRTSSTPATGPVTRPDT